MYIVKDKYYKIIENLLLETGISINGKHAYDIQVHNQKFFKRVLTEGSLGVGESYMDGWWDCENLDLFFCKIFAKQIDEKMKLGIKDLFRVMSLKIRNHQTKEKSTKVAKEHYDLGNDLFTIMLDPYMQYSCGYWKDVDNLNDAQQAKLKLIGDKLNLQPHMKVLDIGCGWGGLAEYLAKNYNVQVDGLTISAEQANMARARCKDLPVNILLKDYRDIQGNYDRIVSVGMFEHVGYKNYKTYFNKVKQILKDDGVFLLHTIGSSKSGVHNDPWINKYVFANGQIPSITKITENLIDSWTLDDWHNLGADYDLTLIEWKHNFISNWDKIKDNYGERFYRMFLYYLNSCAALFRVRELQLWQIVMTKTTNQNFYRVAR